MAQLYLSYNSLEGYSSYLATPLGLGQLKMGRHSSDNDSDSSYKKSRRKSRYRSSSNSSSSSRYSSSRSRHKKCTKKHRKRSGRSRSKEKDKRSRSSRKHSRDRDRHRRSRSQSTSRSPSRYRHRSKESDSGSTYRNRDRRRRKSRSKSSSRRQSRSKDRSSQTKDIRLQDDGADLLEKLNKAAVQAMAENSKLREATLNLVNQMADRESAILEIKQPNFAPKAFSSSASDKKPELPPIIELPEPQVKIAVTPKEFQDSLFHPNILVEDPEEKLNKWTRKLYLMRQRVIRGEPFPYG